MVRGMKGVLLMVLIGGMLCAGQVSGQAESATLPPKTQESYYGQPINGQMLLSANFAEARTNHLHSGIDIRVGGVEGKPLYAVADGYICRIAVSPWGFGRALYIAHPNGTMSVYAHQQKFTPELERYVDDARYRQRRSNVDLFPESDLFVVEKGELIGYAGDSGSSFGPHLHFEIRTNGYQRVMNVGRMGIYDLKDDLHPRVVRLHYIELDTINGVAVERDAVSFDVAKSGDGSYTLSGGEIEVGERGYFVVEATDRKNDTHNTMGIYGVRLYMDGEQIFAFELDSHTFAEQRYVNSLTHFKMQKKSRNELLRLAVQPGNKLPVYGGVVNGGVVEFGDQSVRSFVVEVEDDNKNVSTLEFSAKWGGEDSSLVARGGVPLMYNQAFSYCADGATVTIPSGALYESVLYNQSHYEAEKQKELVLSKIYRVHDEDTPVHTNFSISIDADSIEQARQNRVFIAKVDDKGELWYVGGSYKNGKVFATTRAFGDYCVAIDTIPPTITPQFANGADLTNKNLLSILVDDNLSGVKEVTATIDGVWVPFDRKGKRITHTFNSQRIPYKGTKHEIIITLTDNKDNVTTLKREFVR